VAFTLINRAASFAVQAISIVFVARHLSPAEQGYFYTFASLLALQVFVELGMTNVILQFAAHERARLTTDALGLLSGDPKAKSRLASLLRLAIRWYGVGAASLAAGLTVFGFLFFRKLGATGPVTWEEPWVLAVMGTAGLLWISPALTILEGTGFLTQVAAFRAVQTIVGNAALWVTLRLGGGLYSVGALSAANLFAALGWVLLTKGAFFKDLIGCPLQQGTISWLREIWPLHWRIAVSWLSGYFFSQIFVPVAFKFEGAKEAGRLGMTLSMMGAIYSVAMSWVNTRAPQFGILVAQERFAELWLAYRRASSYAVEVAVLGSAAVVVLVVGLQWMEHPFARRLMDPWQVGVLAVITVLNVYGSAMGVCLRAFKKEPFLVVSIINGLFSCILSLSLGRLYGLSGIVLGYFVTVLVVGFGLGRIVFRAHWRRLGVRHGSGEARAAFE
jgi:hypothetical protein